MAQLQIIFQLILAVILGSAVGLEREYKKKAAGLRTYALVCLGSALFALIGFNASSQFSQPGLDPSRLASQVVLGVGFIGAGLIIYRRLHIEGLTSAAGLWLTAAIGVAVGSQFYLAALVATFLAIIILWLGRKFEERFIKNKQEQ